MPDPTSPKPATAGLATAGLASTDQLARAAVEESFSLALAGATQKVEEARRRVAQIEAEHQVWRAVGKLTDDQAGPFTAGWLSRRWTWTGRRSRPATRPTPGRSPSTRPNTTRSSA